MQRKSIPRKTPAMPCACSLRAPLFFAPESAMMLPATRRGGECHDRWRLMFVIFEKPAAVEEARWRVTLSVPSALRC